MKTLGNAASALVFGALALAAGQPATAAVVLVGNTNGNNVVLVNTDTGRIVRDFIAAGSGGLISPDDLTYGPDGNLYVSSGTKTGGAILRYDGRTGAFIDEFATSDSLRRPYGAAFGPDGLLYVSSFRSDEILTYNATTGAFAGVFASGDGTANGLNGPNDLLFGPDGTLYVTTQGSVADANGDVSFTQKSQILKYDIATGTGTVFVDQPAPWPTSFGFVSYLGLAFGPDGNLYSTDFANGIRAYDLATGSEVGTLDTNYTGTNPSGNFIGNLLFDGPDLLFTGFLTGSGNIGSVLGATIGAPQVLATGALLQRPIGITLAATNIAAVPLPASMLTLLAGLVALGGIARRQRRAVAA